MLLLAGVLVFSDVGALAWAEFTATVAMLFTVGFVERRLRAVAWAAIVVASAFVADFLWRLDWESFYRSDDYESLPQTPLVFIALPIPMVVIAIGVASSAAAIASSARSLTSDGSAPARATRPWRRGRRR